MLLTKVKVKNYLSVKGECELPIDPRVTVLLGANDHGKSNLLRALEHLNFDKPISKEDQNWDSSSARIDYHFVFTTEEVVQLQDVLKQLEVELAEIDAELESITEDEEEVEQADLPVVIPATAVAPNFITGAAAAVVRPAPRPVPPPAQQDPLRRDRDEVEADIAYIQSIVVDSPKVVLSREKVDAPLTLNGRSIEDMDGDFDLAFANMVPRVELFKAFSGELQDSVTADKIEDDDSEFLQGIFFYAGLDPLKSSELFVQDDETDKTLEEASRRLDKALRESWTQGVDLNLHFQLKHRGKTIELLVEDPAVRKRKARMSKRSSGVTQFFRLSMVLHARRQKNPSNSYIYVFDEPGVFLHPKGQKDLLSVFEQLAQDTQIVYATHSLFMLNQNFPERHRLIAKSDQSTIVDAKPYRANWKYAVDALGVRLTANILFSPNILLVEGDSDPIYLYELLRVLNQARETDGDANLLGIMSYGDLPNLRYLMQTFKAESNDRLLVVLFDGDSQGKQYQKEVAALSKRLDVKHISLESGSAIEDYCLNHDLFLKAAHETLVVSYEAMDKKLPIDLLGTIKKSWEEFQQNRTKSQGKEKNKPERTTDKETTSVGATTDETAASNAGQWFKELSLRLIENGSSKVALARNYAFLSRESGTTDSVEIKRLNSCKSLAQQIVDSLRLPSMKAKEEIEVQE